jgi:hypothetical protein
VSGRARRAVRGPGQGTHRAAGAGRPGDPAVGPRAACWRAGKRAVIRAVARWAKVAPSQVVIVSGAAARHKLAGIDREDTVPPPTV